MKMKRDSHESSGAQVPLLLRFILFIARMLNAFLCHADGTLNRPITDFLEYIQTVSASRTPDRHGIATRDILICPHTRVSVRAFYPTIPSLAPSTSTSNGLPVIFYFHGGAFTFLRPNHILYDMFCRRLSHYCNALVLSVDYRRSPEHRYPTAYEDCMSALRWFRDGGAKEFHPLKVDISRCFLSGDSAGANIAHHVGCKVTADAPTMAPLHVKGHVLLFPFFGGEERTASELRLRNKAPLVTMENSDWHWKAFLPKGANRDHHASNVFGPNAPDIACLDLPTSLIAVAELDPLKDWQFQYEERLKKAGKKVELKYYEGGAHAFHLFSPFKLSSTLLRDFNNFLSSLS